MNSPNSSLIWSSKKPSICTFMILSITDLYLSYMALLLQPTSLSQWQALLNEAQVTAAIKLQENLESYLAFMLMRFCQHPEIANTAVGLEFFLALDALPNLQSNKLQEVGDKCLLFAGLFPENAHKRRVSMNYYIELGQTAYSMLSNTDSVYMSLCCQFVALRDVLDAIRDTDLNRTNDLLAYFDLWIKFKSGYALKKLQASSHFSPTFLVPPLPDKKRGH